MNGFYWTTRAVRRFAVIAVMVLVADVPLVRGERVVLDDFEHPANWSVIASDGVDASIAPTAGARGAGLRIAYDFRKGAGFCVIRRAVDLDLPANYRFGFSVRGKGPANNLEFKLVDDSGENVWWVNHRRYLPPASWSVIRYKRRHFSFAWGPAGAVPLKHIGAIEIAISAADGGRGVLDIDTLTFEPLAVALPLAARVAVRASSLAGSTGGTASVLTEGTPFRWRSRPDDPTAWLELDLGAVREFGGLIITWDADDFARDYDISVSTDGRNWDPVVRIRDGDGGRDYLPIRDGEGALIRIDVLKVSRNAGVAVTDLSVQPTSFGTSANATYRVVASQWRRGMLPRYCSGEQVYWTVVGVADDAKEALLDTDGAVEVDERGFRIEPFIWCAGHLVTWADVTRTVSLRDGYLPIPTVTWTTPKGLSLRITALADGQAGASQLAVRYRLVNGGDEPLSGALFLAIRPFQVLPPWQDLNITGGVSSVDSVACHDGVVTVNADTAITPSRPPDAFGAEGFSQGEIVEQLARGRLPDRQAVGDPFHRASGAMRFAFDLKPGDTRSVSLTVPFYAGDGPAAPPTPPVITFDHRIAEVSKWWTDVLNRVEVSLPAAGRSVADTFRTNQAYILINADGPAIQPGSRTYARSWIRDGALTSTALHVTGHHERARAFIEWYAGYQYDDGKIPCVVDQRGPDPVPEHDSAGEFIYAIMTDYRFTRDAAFLARQLPRVESAVRYIQSLRDQCMTAAYREGDAVQRACYGLLPESISHEGYSAKPMHSYWDDLFVLKGLKDAVDVAEVLGRDDLASPWRKLRDGFADSLYASMRLSIGAHKIDYIPGCVELGDFDATSTAIGVFPCGELDRLPEPALRSTFDRYFDYFTKRRDGRIAWRNYTPYEIRLIGTFVRLDRPERANALLDYFLGDRRPAHWNHWAEVVWKDPATPRFIGDMPHTWVGGEFINAVRSMFVYENGGRLELLAGVRPGWIEADQGVALTRWPTFYGRLDLSAACDGGEWVIHIAGSCDPPGGVSIHLPPDRTPVSVVVDNRPAAIGSAVSGVLRLDRMPKEVRIGWE